MSESRTVKGTVLIAMAFDYYDEFEVFGEKFVIHCDPRDTDILRVAHKETGFRVDGPFYKDDDVAKLKSEAEVYLKNTIGAERMKAAIEKVRKEITGSGKPILSCEGCDWRGNKDDTCDVCARAYQRYTDLYSRKQ